jgi:hypothetical protein
VEGGYRVEGCSDSVEVKYAGREVKMAAEVKVKRSGRGEPVRKARHEVFSANPRCGLQSR